METIPRYRIEEQDDELVVRIPKGLLGADELSRFLDFLELISLKREIGMSDEDVDALAREVDARAWERKSKELDDQ